MHSWLHKTYVRRTGLFRLTVSRRLVVSLRRSELPPLFSAGVCLFPRHGGGMQNELRISAGGLYPRPKTHTESDFEPGHGLQRRPSVAIEDVRDSRGGDAGLLRDPFDASVAVPLSPEVNHHGLNHRVLRRAHVQAVGPARIQFRWATWLRSHHALTVAPGTSNTLLGVGIAAFRPKVRLPRDLVRPETRFEHRLGRRDGVKCRPPLAGNPATKDCLSNAGPLSEVFLRRCPPPFDIPLNLADERLTHAHCLGVDGRQRLSLDIGPLGVGLARRRVGGHGLHRTGGRGGLRSGGRCGGTALSRKGVGSCR